MVVIGSLRRGSVNAALARAAITNAPEGMGLVPHDVRDLPFYDGDIEDAGPPPEVVALHDAIAASDGLVIFSPEYNSSFPALTKNVVDWFTRPPRAWADKPVTMAVTTPGGRAGLGLRSHFAATMAHQPIRLFEPLGLGNYRDRLDDDGEFRNAETVTELVQFLSAFGAFCREAAKPADAQASTS